jgi:gliding motility-associated-like protein
MKKEILLSVLICLLSGLAEGQNSFSQLLFWEDTGLPIPEPIIGDNIVLQNDSLSFYVSRFFSTFSNGLEPEGLFFNRTSSGQLTCWGAEVIDPFFNPDVCFRLDRNEVNGVVARVSDTPLGEDSIVMGNLYLDQNTGAGWCVGTHTNTNVLGGIHAFISPGELLIDHFWSKEGESPFVGLASIDVATGNQNWSFEYRKQGAPETGLSYIPRSIFFREDGTLLFSGLHFDGEDVNIFFLNLTTDGTILSSRAILRKDLELFGHIPSSDGGSLLYGRIDDGNPSISNETGFIAKLDGDLNLIWAREIPVVNFHCVDLEVVEKTNGEIIFAYQSLSEFPIIIGRLSGNGELLEENGYSTFFAKIALSADGELLLVSTRNSQPPVIEDIRLVISKSDAQGNIAECPQFSACVSLEAISFEFEEWDWEVMPGDTLPFFDVEFTQLGVFAEDFCVNPPPPTPTFTFPDTLCAGACASPDSLNNRLAHQAQWYVQGPGVDTLIADTTFALCFIEPGEYLIEQEVWLLGCSEIEQHTLTVLPPLQTSFNRTDTICGALPVSLSVQADRVLRDWNWSTGATIPSLPIAQSGTYAVTVSDGYCADTLSAELTLVAELAEEAVVQLPPEQTICATELPYLLQPFSPYTTNFTLLNNGEEGTVFALTEPGTYTVQADYLGCPFTSTFRLQTSACANTLYWPNVFSPNADGINDRWAPQSPEHDLTLLQIYDRWGGLVYESRAADAYWDGRGRDGQPATAGVYVSLVRYRHRVSGEEGMEQGEVLLMR